MSTQQFQGKTVEEATKLALEELKANLEEVNIEIISPGKSGILGLGGEPALIEVTISDDGKSTKPSKAKKSNKKRQIFLGERWILLMKILLNSQLIW